MTEVSSIELEWLFELVPNNFFTDARKAMALERHRNAVYGSLGKRKFGEAGVRGDKNLLEASITNTAPSMRFKKGLNVTKFASKQEQSGQEEEPKA